MSCCLDKFKLNSSANLSQLNKIFPESRIIGQAILGRETCAVAKDLAKTPNSGEIKIKQAD